MERVIKLETNYENLKSIVENNHKSIKGNIDTITQKQSATDIVLHKQEVYQVRIEGKIDSLALDIKQFREDSAKNRKIQQERLDKIEQERLEEINRPNQTWSKIKVSIITSISTGIAVSIIYFLLKNIKF